MHLEFFLIAVASLVYPAATPTTSKPWSETEQRLSARDQFQGLEQFWELLEYLLMCRTVGAIQDGRLLVAPDFAEAGDVVAILAGCSNPVVLRKDDASSTFRLLGDAHLMGIAPGETSENGLVEFVLS